MQLVAPVTVFVNSWLIMLSFHNQRGTPLVLCKIVLNEYVIHCLWFAYVYKTMRETD